MDAMKRFEPLFLLLMMLGALNWLAVGLFDTNVVTEIFGTGGVIDVIYVVFGVAALTFVPKLMEGLHVTAGTPAPARVVAPARIRRRTGAAGEDPGPPASADTASWGNAIRRLTAATACRYQRQHRRPVDYPVETFTEAERARLAPHFSNLDQPVFALVNLPETVKGALFARYSRYQGTLRRLYLDEFAADLPAATAAAWDGRRGRARGAALRAHLRRLRRRLGGPARRRPHRLRVGLQRAHEDPPAAAPGRLPRAVHALHRLRRADARPARRLPLLPRRRAGPGVRRRDGRHLRCLFRGTADRHRLGRRALPPPG